MAIRAFQLSDTRRPCLRLACSVATSAPAVADEYPRAGRRAASCTASLPRAAVQRVRTVVRTRVVVQQVPRTGAGLSTLRRLLVVTHRSCGCARVQRRLLRADDGVRAAILYGNITAAAAPACTHGPLAVRRLRIRRLVGYRHGYYGALLVLEFVNGWWPGHGLTVPRPPVPIRGHKNHRQLIAARGSSTSRSFFASLRPARARSACRKKSFGCRNSTGLPCAPIFGSPSPSTRMPCPRNASRAAMMSATS